jgi:hypothetical protein
VGHEHDTSPNGGSPKLQLKNQQYHLQSDNIPHETHNFSVTEISWTKLQENRDKYFKHLLLVIIRYQVTEFFT